MYGFLKSEGSAFLVTPVRQANQTKVESLKLPKVDDSREEAHPMCREDFLFRNKLPSCRSLFALHGCAEREVLRLHDSDRELTASETSGDNCDVRSRNSEDVRTKKNPSVTADKEVEEKGNIGEVSLIEVESCNGGVKTSSRNSGFEVA